LSQGEPELNKNAGNHTKQEKGTITQEGERLTSSSRRKRTGSFYQEESPNFVLKCLMDKFDLDEVWREQFPNDKQYTRSNNDCSRQSRIDYWLVFQIFNEGRHFSQYQ